MSDRKSVGPSTEEIALFRRRPQTLLEHASDAIITTDPGFTILGWSGAALELYGWSAEDAIGREMGKLVPTECCDGQTHGDVIARLHEHGEWTGEVLQTCKDGRRIHVRATVSVVTDEAHRRRQSSATARCSTR